jgi:hypothetical protein
MERAAKKLSDTQMELFAPEAVVSEAMVPGESERTLVRRSMNRSCKHPGRQELPSNLPVGRGKLLPVETPSARLFGRGSPRVCRSPDPAPPRPYSCCVGRPAFIDSSDEVINKGVLRQQPYRFLFVGGYESGVVA